MTPEQYYHRSIQLYESGKNTEALQLIDEAISRYPDQGYLYTSKGVFLMSMSKWDEARSCQLKALEVNPANAIACYNLAQIESQSGDFDKAISFAEKAIRIDPDFAMAYSIRGYLKYCKGDYEGAIKDYYEALDIDPMFMEMYRNIGNLYLYDLKDYPKAIEIYSKAINKGIRDFDIYNNRGNAKFKMDDQENAIPDYISALEIDPDNKGAISNLKNARMIYEAKKDNSIARINLSELRKNPPGWIKFDDDGKGFTIDINKG